VGDGYVPLDRPGQIPSPCDLKARTSQRRDGDKNLLKVTLALLAYNEEAAIEAVTRAAAAEMARSFAAGEWELLVVDDGSDDGTRQILASISTAVERVRVYQHETNRGYREATLSALREARGHYICIFDGDGQHSAADVPRFVKKLEAGCDVVFGWKQVRRDPPWRAILSYGLRRAARYYLNASLHDINAGCRGYRKDVVAQLSRIKHCLNFVGPELYTRARIHDLRICEMPVRHAERRGGRSSHGWRKIPAEVCQVVIYLRALRAELRANGKHQGLIP
jgi:dolichol-phosphate mannosyltransferase